MSKKIEGEAKGLVLLEGHQIDKMVKVAITSSHTAAKNIHAAAVQCLLHAETHGDPRKLDNLVKGLHKSSRPEALKTWASTYSPVVWNGDGKVGILPQTSKKYMPFDVPAANEDPYWNPDEKVTKPLTLAMLKAMISRMEKKLDKAEDEGAIADGENVVELRAFVRKVTAAAEAAAQAA